MTSPRKKVRTRERKPKGEARSGIDPRLIPFAKAYGDILFDAVLADPRMSHVKAEIAAEETRRVADRAASRERQPPD